MRRERQSFAVVAGTGEEYEMRKWRGTSESFDFLIFHHVAVDHGFAAGSGAVVVCGLGVQAGYLLI